MYRSFLRKIVEPQFFEGMNDTLRILTDAAEGKGHDLLAQLKEELETAVNFPPTTLSATWLCLNQLVTTATNAEANFSEGPENEAKLWAHALVLQCQDTLNELKFLTPWISHIVTRDSNGLTSVSDKLPTLRELTNIADRKSTRL